MAKLSFKRGILLLAVIFAGFTAYWALGQKFIIRQLNNTIQDANASGYTFTHKGVGLSGFPFSYVLRIGQPNIAASQARKPWSFRGENFYFKTRPWLPLRWHFRHIDEARIDIRGPLDQRYLFDVTPLKIEGDVVLNFSGNVKNLSATGHQITPRDVIGATPPVNSIENIEITVNDTGPDAELSIMFRDVFLPTETFAELQSVLGPRIETVSVEMKALGLGTIDAAGWAAFETNGTMQADRFKLEWNALQLQGRFTLENSPTGMSGPVTISVQNEKELLNAFEEAGLISQNEKNQILLAMTFAPKNEADHPELTFNISENAIMFLGQAFYRF